MPRRDPDSGLANRTWNSERRAWLFAWLFALALHVVLFFGVGRALPVRAAAPPQAPETLQVTLSDPARDTREPDQPRNYSELPKDRADQAPKTADFLGNVTSRARDLTPAGDAPLPRLHGEADFPMVKLERKDAATPPQAAAPAGSPEADKDGAHAAEPGQRSVLYANQKVANTNLRAAHVASGSSDLPQPEMDNPNGDARLGGDVSLNTTAWDYAPWLDHYRSQLMDHWFAPSAYNMGILKEGGWAEIAVEISRSGQVLHVDLLGQEGHPSLIQAAESAVRASTPTDALPANFPEPTLVLHIRMYYLKVRPRS